MPLGQRLLPRVPSVLLGLEISTPVLRKMLNTSHLFVQDRVGRSAVSQRDLSKAFRAFYFFFCHGVARGSVRLDGAESVVDGLLTSCALAVGLVYYLRLNDALRQALTSTVKEALAGDPSIPGRFRELDVGRELENEMGLYVEQIELGKGVAWNRALKENVFAITVSIQLKFAVVIVGAPGSTKTLSFQVRYCNRGPPGLPCSCPPPPSSLVTFNKNFLVPVAGFPLPNSSLPCRLCETTC